MFCFFNKCRKIANLKFRKQQKTKIALRERFGNKVKENKFATLVE